VFQDGSVKTILAKSHEAPSGRTPTSKPRLPSEPDQVKEAFADVRPHFASLRRTKQPLPQVTAAAYEVLTTVNG
jgi:hypothetical protein